MKSHPRPQSATSLPRAPRDEAHTRQTKYFLMMSVRVVCFVLMVVIQPYGWYTFVLGAGAVVLPYLAVVVANVASRGGEADRIDPERALPETATAPPAPAPDTTSGVIRITESDRRPPADS